jgi:hypothetical protein
LYYDNVSCTNVLRNTRGWTAPEFLAPKVICFYQQDWALYLDDHKEFSDVMDELEGATTIDIRALDAFQQGMKDARETLQRASVPEDYLLAYSWFRIFGIQLPIIYGENALGHTLCFHNTSVGYLWHLSTNRRHHQHSAPELAK